MKTNVPILRFYCRKKTTRPELASKKQNSKSTDTQSVTNIAQNQSKCASVTLCCSISYKGRVQRGIGITIYENEWDENKERVKRSCINYRNYNEQLNKLSEKFDDGLNRGLFNPNDLMEYIFNENSGIRKDVISVFNLMKEEKNLSYGSGVTYMSVLKSIGIFLGKSVYYFDDIDENVLRRYIGNRVKDGVKEGTLRTYMQMFYSVWHYAYRNRYVSYDISDCYKYWKDLDIPNNKRALKEEEIEYLFNYYCKKICFDNSNENCYKINEEYVDDIILHKRDIFCLGVFLLGFLCQGLALVDLCKLKKDNISKLNYNGKDYYIIKTERSKTGADVNIAIPIDFRSELIFSIFYNRINENGYLLPILDDSMDEGEKTRTVNKFTTKVNTGLKKVVDSINNAGGIHINDFTYYATRHTFATTFVRRSGNLLDLAVQMGRSVNGIFAYIKQLNAIEDIIKSKEQIFGK